jgi:hypothetical protein
LLDVGACAQVPKYIMASGNLVKVHPRMSIEHRLGSIAFTRAALCMKVLIHTGTADYMEYKPVDGSFVYRCSIPVAGLCNTVLSLNVPVLTTAVAQLAVNNSRPFALGLMRRPVHLPFAPIRRSLGWSARTEYRAEYSQYPLMALAADFAFRFAAGAGANAPNNAKPNPSPSMVAACACVSCRTASQRGRWVDVIAAYHRQSCATEALGSGTRGADRARCEGRRILSVVAVAVRMRVWAGGLAGGGMGNHSVRGSVSARIALCAVPCRAGTARFTKSQWRRRRPCRRR